MGGLKRRDLVCIQMRLIPGSKMQFGSSRPSEKTSRLSAPCFLTLTSVSLGAAPISTFRFEGPLITDFTLLSQDYYCDSVLVTY